MAEKKQMSKDNKSIGSLVHSTVGTIAPWDLCLMFHPKEMH